MAKPPREPLRPGHYKAPQTPTDPERPERPEHPKRDVYDWITLGTAIVGVVLVTAGTGISAAGVWAAWGQLKAARGQLDVMSQQMRDSEMAGFLSDEASDEANARQDRMLVANQRLANAARTQAEELHAQQRPWVAVTGVEAWGDLTMSEKVGAILPIKVNVAVIGSRPALRVWTESAGMFVSTANLLKIQRNFCNKPYNLPKKVTQPEITVFPGQGYTLPSLGYISAEDVRHMRSIGVTKVSESIVGCVLYQDGTRRWHHTGFIFDVLIKNGLGPGLVGAPDFSVSRVPATDVLFRNNLAGGGNAD